MKDGERPAPPRTRFLRPFANHVVNPITRRLVHHLPGFGLLSHRGRKSGAIHRTPVNVFRRDGLYVFALTYGSDVDWVRNVVAAGGADLRMGGRTVHLTAPEVFVDPERRSVPAPVRLVLRLMGVTEFLRMRPAAG